MGKELTFPLKFKCPRCSSEERVVEITSAKEKTEGLLPSEGLTSTRPAQLLLAEQDKLQAGQLAGKKVRLLQFYYDICAKCGTEYLYHIKLGIEDVPGRRLPPEILLPGQGQGFKIPRRNN